VQDQPEAQYNLGVIYGDGIGIARDDREAARWYRLAATQGDVAAQLNLGGIFARSGSPLADRIAAYMWLAIASKNKQARESRDRLAAKMTPQQIEQAKNRVKTCRASGYLDCG
jgi:TPR repeat protein